MKKIALWVLLFGAGACSHTPPQKLSTEIKALRDTLNKDEIPWDFKPGEIKALCKAYITEAEHRLDAITKVPAANRNPENTFLAFEDTLADFDQNTSPLMFVQATHVNEALRKESLDCEQSIQPFYVKIFTRRDLYNAVKDVAPTDAASKRLHSETVKAFENNGLKLPDEKLKKLKILQERAAKISSDFSFNIADEKSTLSFTKEELEGAPNSFLSRLKTDSEGKYIVTTSYPDYFGVMDNVSVEETRKKMATLYNNRAATKNIPLLKEILRLRQEMATLLGHPTWADYKTSHGRMAKSSKEVWDFLNSLKGKLSAGNAKDMKLLLDFKKKLAPGSTKLNPWDLPYLTNQYKKKNFNIDEEIVREYFPSEDVVLKMFKVYSTLLGVTYERVKDTKVWSPDVQYYKVTDKKSGQTVAYFYTDFIPREGKYNHAAAFPLRVGRILPTGKYQIPIAAIVANFNPPADGKPSLLSHEEVETLFHEFGHIMHQVLTRAPYASLAGTSVARDFVEAPSQMLEEWVWSPQILPSLSGHYKNPQKKLPAHLMKKMIGARNFLKSNFYTRQLWLGTVDMTFHSNPPSDINTTEVQQKLYKDIIDLDPLPESKFEAAFGHLMGYDAGYYGYLWSEVFAADMFTLFQKGGLLSPTVGAKYRQTILEKGNMVDADVLLKEFLGRKPSTKPFYKKLGLKI